ncbi:MAG: polyphosphate polymerase domain-containing protein, partial [Solobacterium sp.]|nr:polyphosphate polymerase domain-containing protein [Solobacterium sp.]
FIQIIHKHIQKDMYFQYTVRSLYFDNDNSELAIQSLLKPDYKMKLRLRCYGEPSEDKPVFLETKKKYENIVYKRRIDLGYKEAFDYIDYGIPHSVKSNTADEIDYLMKYYNLEPKVYIAYDRNCYSAINESDVRITFDTNIRYRIDDISLKETGNEKFLKEGMVMLEVKATKRYPMWLVDALSEMKIYRTSFSKYGTIYSENYDELSPKVAMRYENMNQVRGNLICSVQY